MKLFKIIIAAILLQYCFLNLSAQSVQKILPDDNFTLALAFHKTDTVLVVTPDSYLLTNEDKRDIERYVFWGQWQKKPIYIFKREFELNDTDYSRKIQLYGPFAKFKNKKLVESPFRQTPRGFELENVRYEMDEDAMFYITSDASRMFTCRNSTKHNNIYTQIAAGSYQLYVFRGNEIMITGFEESEKPGLKLNKLEQLRGNYFRQLYTEYTEFGIPTHLLSDSLKSIINSDIDSYIKSLCSHLGVETNIKRLKTYVYSDMADLQFFIAVPKAMTVYGKSIGNISHLKNFDLTTFKHETAHSIIEEKIGKTENVFFLEGFATYTAYMFSREAFSNDVEVVRKNIDLLKKSIMKEGSFEFYSNMIYYPLSAVFTKYLIDLMGLNHFKKVYVANDIEDAVLNITGKNFEQHLADFKRYLDNIGSVYPPDCLWRFQTDGRVYSSPVIIDEFLLAGSGDSCLYALNKSDGRLIWKYKTGGAVHSTPAVSGENVFISSSDGALYSININSGMLNWKFKSSGEKMKDIWDYYLSSPRVSNGDVFWGSADSCLYALDQKSGSIRWKFKAAGIIHATPEPDEGTLYIGDYGGFLYALNANDGSLKWSFKTVGDRYFPEGEIQKGVSVDEHNVYFGSRDYNIYAVNKKTGKGVWNNKEGSWVISTPSVHGNKLFFGTSDTHEFVCFDKITGKSLWRLPVPMRVYGSAAVIGNIVYFGCFDGTLKGADVTDGRIVFEYKTKGNIDNSAKVYGQDGKFREGFELYGKNYLDSENTIHTLGAILSTPVVDDISIYFGSSDGGIYRVLSKDN